MSPNKQSYHPTILGYTSNGTGRDSYISFNDGGNKAGSLCANGNLFSRDLTPPKHYNPQPQKISFQPRYVTDGSGRDSYVYSNNGGFAHYGNNYNYDYQLRKYNIIDRPLRKERDLRDYQHWVVPRTLNTLKKQKLLQDKLIERLSSRNYLNVKPKKIYEKQLNKTENTPINFSKYNLEPLQHDGIEIIDQKPLHQHQNTIAINDYDPYLIANDDKLNRTEIIQRRYTGTLSKQEISQSLTPIRIRYDPVGEDQAVNRCKYTSKLILDEIVQKKQNNKSPLKYNHIDAYDVKFPDLKKNVSFISLS